MKPIHPGSVLRDHMERHRIPQAHLAIMTGVSRLTINQLVNERRDFTVPMAVKLSRALNTTAEFWLALQMEQ